MNKIKKAAIVLLTACMAMPSCLNVFAEEAEPTASASSSASADESKENHISISANGLEDGYQLTAEPVSDKAQVEAVQSFLDDREVIAVYDIVPVNVKMTDPEKGAEITLTFSKDTAPDTDKLKKAGLYQLIDYTLPETDSNSSASESSTTTVDSSNAGAVRYAER